MIRIYRTVLWSSLFKRKVSRTCSNQA